MVGFLNRHLSLASRRSLRLQVDTGSGHRLPVLSQLSGLSGVLQECVVAIESLMPVQRNRLRSTLHSPDKTTPIYDQRRQVLDALSILLARMCACHASFTGGREAVFTGDHYRTLLRSTCQRIVTVLESYQGIVQQLVACESGDQELTYR